MDELFLENGQRTDYSSSDFALTNPNFIVLMQFAAYILVVKSRIENKLNLSLDIQGDGNEMHALTKWFRNQCFRAPALYTIPEVRKLNEQLQKSLNLVEGKNLAKFFAFMLSVLCAKSVGCVSNINVQEQLPDKTLFLYTSLWSFDNCS